MRLYYNSADFLCRQITDFACGQYMAHRVIHDLIHPFIMWLMAKIAEPNSKFYYELNNWNISFSTRKVAEEKWNRLYRNSLLFWNSVWKSTRSIFHSFVNNVSLYSPKLRWPVIINVLSPVLHLVTKPLRIISSIQLDSKSLTKAVFE